MNPRHNEQNPRVLASLLALSLIACDEKTAVDDIARKVCGLMEQTINATVAAHDRWRPAFYPRETARLT